LKVLLTAGSCNKGILLTFVLFSEAISVNKIALKYHKKFMCRSRHLLALSWLATRSGMKLFCIEIMVIFIPENQVFIIIVFVVVTIATIIITTHISTYLIIIRITTAVP
jgi:hypothetical protein